MLFVLLLNIKSYAFEVELVDLKTKGLILCDHMKSLDYRNRRVKFIEKSSTDILSEVVAKVNALIEK